MAEPKPYLSKSRYLQGLQCFKLLWTVLNENDAIPKPGETTQALFDQGHLVGNLAKLLFPGGIEIDWEDGDYTKAMGQSIELFEKRKPLYEAGFRFNGLYARADILKPVKGGWFDLIEVKAATSIKQVHLEDVAFQRYVFEGAGIKIRKCFLMHIDTGYERQGEIEPEKLFAQVDVTKETVDLLPSVEPRAAEMREAVRSKNCPIVEPGDQCSDPYKCCMSSLCSPETPARHVSELYRGGARAGDLEGRGIHLLGDIPDDYPLTERQAVQVAAAKADAPVIDADGIAEFLNGLTYPLHFLDFETFYMCPVPMYDQSHPYEQVPFQFSLHIVREPGSESEHHEFLAEGKGDPRPVILRILRQLLGSKGSIIAWNVTFEKNRLAECVDRFPEYRKWNEKLIGRFVDLIAPFRAFHYYHPDQAGSCSLKDVLPSVTGKGYDDLEVGDGETAATRFMAMTFGDMPESERAATRAALLDYCGLDTGGMIDILRKLEKMR